MTANPDEMVSDDTDDIAYKWTVRTLYVTLIGLNIWVYWRMVRDDPEMAVARAQVDRMMARLRAPFQRERAFRRAVGRMHWEALQTLETAPDSEGDTDG